MSRSHRSQLTFWSVHLALLVGVLGWVLAFEPSLVNLVAVVSCLVMPSLTALVMYRDLILGRAWLALGRATAAASRFERFLRVLRQRPWLSDLRMLSLPSRFGALETQAKAYLGQAHLALGQRDSARDWVRSALRCEPDSDEVRDLLEQLSQTPEVTPTSERSSLLSVWRERESVPPARVSLLSEPPSH